MENYKKKLSYILGMFIKNQAAMKIGNYLVVSDIHIGLTKDLWQAGVSLPSQVSSLAKRINKLKRLTHAKYLVINGDLKHKVTGISAQERREVPEFISLLRFSKIVIIKGNHDGNIEKLIDDRRVSVKKSLAVGSCLITHGHMSVKTTKKIIVVGHNHPCVRFRDEMGAVYTEPVWVRGKAEEKDAKGVMHSKTIIIMPAFNELSGYYTVNKGRFQGPVASTLTKSAHIYLLDGTDLGRIRDVKLKE